MLVHSVEHLPSNVVVDLLLHFLVLVEGNLVVGLSELVLLVLIINVRLQLASQLFVLVVSVLVHALHQRLKLQLVDLHVAQHVLHS